MKVNKLSISLLTAALLVPALGACSVSGNEIDRILDKLETGFTLNGTVSQSRQVYVLNNQGQLEPTDQNESQQYDVEVLYEASDRIGSCITHFGELSGTKTIINQILAYVDDEGYAYQEFLDYQNKVQRKYLDEYNNKLNFGAAGLYNFASILNSSDFTYHEDKEIYDVNIDKAGLIAKNILGHVNSGFTYTPIIATVNVKDGMFEKMDIIIEEYGLRAFQDGQYLEIRYSNSVEFTFSKVGETKLERVKAFDAKPENAELRVALDKIGDNFTMETESELSIDDGAVNKKYREHKFTGDKILVHDFNNGTDRLNYTADNHFILQRLEGSENESLYSYVYNDISKTYTKKEHRNFAKNYQGQYYYEDLLPKPSIISTDLFKYDADVNEYVTENFDVCDAIKPIISISRAPLSNDHMQNAFKVGIRLTDTGDLDYIKFYINYKNLLNGSVVKGTVKEYFTRIGSTTLWGK